ncbi:MAG: signal peptidase I [Eubacteriales bacterium]|nr:signal peptidase I [Eubacteriales bacterium]
MGLYTYEDNSTLRGIIHWVVDIIVVISFAWFIVFSFFDSTIINGHSMSPTLEADDMCLVNRLSYDLGNPKRFDIVVFERNDTNKTNVKRVIGLPGETVQIISGAIYINGEKISDESISNISLPGIAENPVELQDDEYFLLGDNADSSEDSRFSNIGNVKRDKIIGKVWFRLKPFKSIGLIK